MKHIRALNLSFALALAAALAAAPADAQGKGKDKKDRERTEQARSRSFRPEDGERRSDRWEDEVRLERRGGKRVPEGWCRGKGNPHNTVENCGPGADRYDRRDDRRYESGSGSFDQDHAAYHREQDRVCRERASQRPFDLRYQLQVRQECKAEHERWHDRYDPNRRY